MNELWMVCTCAAVLLVAPPLLVFLVMIAGAPEGAEIPGVGFVRTGRKGRARRE